MATTCSGGALFAGEFDGGYYMITPGNCTDSATPTCDGSTDSLTKAWYGSSGSAVDIPGVSNISSNSTPSSSSERGHVTTPIITAHSSISSDSAADYCNDMTYGGYSDWYLPSKSELAYIYCHANVSGGNHNTSYPQEDVNCVSQGGKASELPGFAAQFYWSSTEYSNLYAWRKDFDDGRQFSLLKSTSWLRVRCIRRYDPCSGNPKIGTLCPGGAIYAGQFDGGKYMVTPGNCTDSATPTCDGGTDSLNKAWRGSSGSNVDIPGVSNIASSSTPSSSSERGHVTTPIITAHASISPDSAADYCNDMTYGGYNDWYLPSKSEMAYIYCHANISGGSHNTSRPQEDVNCVSVGGKTSDLPGFANATYLSSTEFNSNYAWTQLASGFQLADGKNFTFFRVRCVRRY